MTCFYSKWLLVLHMSLASKLLLSNQLRHHQKCGIYLWRALWEECFEMVQRAANHKLLPVTETVTIQNQVKNLTATHGCEKCPFILKRKKWILLICLMWGLYQTLLAQQTEQHGVAHFPQVLETYSFQLSILNYVFQLVVKEFQDSWKEKHNLRFLRCHQRSNSAADNQHLLINMQRHSWFSQMHISVKWD